MTNFEMGMFSGTVSFHRTLPGIIQIDSKAPQWRLEPVDQPIARPLFQKLAIRLNVRQNEQLERKVG